MQEKPKPVELQGLKLKLNTKALATVKPTRPTSNKKKRKRDDFIDEDDPDAFNESDFDDGDDNDDDDGGQRGTLSFSHCRSSRKLMC